jgi:hypothetical protein
MERRWIETAERARRMLEAMPADGSILARRAEVAAKLGLTKETLHNYIEASRFVERLGGTAPEMAKAMEGLSATTVGVYSRWYRRDPEEASAHARRAVEQNLSSARVAADERAARAAAPIPSLLDLALASIHDERRSVDVSDDIGAALTAGGAGGIPLRWLERAPNSIPLSKAMGASEVLRPLPVALEPEIIPPWLDQRVKTGLGLDLIAIMEIERGAPGDAHRRNARNMIARAALVATVHPMALILVPDVDAVREFVAAVPILADHAVVPSSANLAAFSFGRGGGVVAVMGAEGFSQAWSSTERS